MEKEKTEVLTTNEACEYLRISRPTFLKLVHTKQIRARKLGRGWKVLKSDLRGLFEMQKRKNKHKWTEQTRRENEFLHVIDWDILRILSLYKGLTPLQIWYEVGDAEVIKTGVTQKELKDRLESLVARGLVERIGKTSAGGDLPSHIYRLKTSDAVSMGEEETIKEVGL
jgi:excisionase family DNA binding protein